MAIERLDLGGYDLIISSSHCVAKGVCHDTGSLHICYCHTPMRYIWVQDSEYSSTMGLLNKAAMAFFRRYLQAWDLRSAGHVDLYLANSHNVARRIERIYGRGSRVVWPPVDTEYFTPDDGVREDFYLAVSALAPYKCIDHAVEAFSRLNLPLKVIGSGQMLGKLRRSSPRNVRFLGWQSDEVVREHYRRCKALIFPGEEDFGMVPVEAMACGTPVIAYKAGGALETVIDVDAADPHGPTGLLYEPHTIESLVDAVRRFETMSNEFPQERLAAWTGNFGREQFRRRFLDAIKPELEIKGMRLSC
jgi:glycosyltransferase involved in cell wall biosynthesis